jgi:monofunctional biosynthetic peptidoglycan transglycosylase
MQEIAIGAYDEPRAPRRSWPRRIARAVWRVAVGFVVLSVAAVLLLRFVAPPTTAFMIARRVSALVDRESGFVLRHEWRPWSRVSAELPLALVAAEDQKFPSHHGFDLDAIELAWVRNERGRTIRGASTISQQTAKNLFLWRGRSWLRKGLEAYFTVLIEALWPKRRILEVYLNVVEFGNGIYGAEAASRAFFGKSADALDADQAALLAAVLPNPRKYRVDRPSRYVLQAAQWNRRQMRQLGGPAYLREL